MIVLLTDFGLKDAYVAVMKAVILNIAPNEQVIDLTHEIQSQNIAHANTILIDNYHYFPKGTIFCCVIDPGVGTHRKSIIVKNKDYTYVGPDNGLFTNLINSNSKIYLLNTPVHASNTFHGRDVYAPSSASLTIKESFLNNLKQIPPSSCHIDNSLLLDDQIKTQGSIIYSDHFGNLISNIRAKNLPKKFKIMVDNLEIPFVKTYDEICNQQIAVLFSSSNRLEIAMKNSSALTYFKKLKLELIFDIAH
ncbi:MAG: SAM-dependent chlorinase/fluorinase [Candidatus Cloacimonetes bacterium]|nr:SAM-dependent chlorinase/fluorinase [Candidatus Cloacimonadota bacterium]